MLVYIDLFRRYYIQVLDRKAQALRTFFAMRLWYRSTKSGFLSIKQHSHPILKVCNTWNWFCEDYK